MRRVPPHLLPCILLLKSTKHSRKLQFSASSFLSSSSSKAIFLSFMIISFLQSSLIFSILRLANSKGSTSTFFKGITIAFTLFLMLPKTYQNFMDSPYTEICQKLCMKQSKISIGSSKILIKSLVSLMQVASIICTYLSKVSESSTLTSSEASSEDNFRVIWYCLYLPEKPDMACICSSFIGLQYKQRFQQNLQRGIEMNSQPHQCKDCEIANSTLNHAHEKSANLFLVCEDRHVLCQACYQAVYHNQNIQTCPFDQNAILRVKIPVKGYKFGQESVLIEKKIQEINSIDDERKELLKAISTTKENIANLPQLLKQELKRKNQLIDKHIQTKMKLYDEKAKLQEKYYVLRSQRIKRHAIVMFSFDSVCSLICATSTVFQLIVLFTSLGTDKQDVLSTSFYFISVAMSIILLNIRLLLESYIYLIMLLFLFPGYYLRLIVMNQYKRWQRYTKKPSIQAPLPFQKANYSFFICKTAIFLQFFTRYYQFWTNDFHSLIFAFSILQIFALISFDISYFHLMSKGHEKVTLTI